MSGGGVGFDLRGVEDLGCDVAAKEAPPGAVSSGADFAAVVGVHLAGGEGLGPVGEDGAILDECFVGQGVGPYEDGRAGPDMEGYDGAVFGLEGGFGFVGWF